MSETSERRAWLTVSGDLFKTVLTTIASALATAAVMYFVMRSPAHADTPLALPQAYAVYERLASLETEMKNVKSELSDIKDELRALNKFLK